MPRPDRIPRPAGFLSRNQQADPKAFWEETTEQQRFAWIQQLGLLPASTVKPHAATAQPETSPPLLKWGLGWKAGEAQ